MDKSQVGRAGELAVQLYALVTAGGQIDIYSPVVDDDHVDLVAGLRGAGPSLAIQVKAAPGLDHSGLVEARASYPVGNVREDPHFIYVVVLLEKVRIDALWIVPSADFNRLAYRIAEPGRVAFEFRASPTDGDAFSAFRIDPMQLGPSLLGRIRDTPRPPAWVLALTGRH